MASNLRSQLYRQRSNKKKLPYEKFKTQFLGKFDFIKFDL